MLPIIVIGGFDEKCDRSDGVDDGFGGCVGSTFAGSRDKK
jgi:hypothetical protein